LAMNPDAGGSPATTSAVTKKSAAIQGASRTGRAASIR
jgi:hypothetical protein